MQLALSDAMSDAKELGNMANGECEDLGPKGRGALALLGYLWIGGPNGGA